MKADITPTAINNITINRTMPSPLLLPTISAWCSSIISVITNVYKKKLTRTAVVEIKTLNGACFSSGSPTTYLHRSKISSTLSTVRSS